jgi:hypothetical protein
LTTIRKKKNIKNKKNIKIFTTQMCGERREAEKKKKNAKSRWLSSRTFSPSCLKGRRGRVLIVPKESEAKLTSDS